MANKGSTAMEVTLSFLLGTATGFILGVLFAPASGEETRKKIHERAAKTGEKAMENYGKIAKEAEKGINIVKEKTTEGIDAVKEFVERKKEELARKPIDPEKSEEKKG